MTKIFIKTLWLDAVDYPILLGCTTLGISLHTSTSGIDLPMKVLDMFGCGVPVAAVGFKALEELVQDGVNGVVFHTSNDLCEQLLGLLGKIDVELSKLRKGVGEGLRWEGNWTAIMHDEVLKGLERHIDGVSVVRFFFVGCFSLVVCVAFSAWAKQD